MITSAKYLFKHKFWFLSLILVLSGLSDLYAQCKINAPITKLCRGNSVTFTVNTTAPRYLWNSGDGKTENKQTATFLYDHYGVFKLKVILYNADNTIRCKDSINITVYDLPNASMLVGSSIELCYNKDYCFINNSTRGANNAPLTQFLWLFGDGDLSTQKNPCHRYDYTGDYLIFLNVKDSNTCESKLEKKVHVVVGSSLKPKFTMACTDSCPVTKARFINLTDTFGKNIRKFIMDFGDGTKDSSITKRDFSHTYTKDSIFVPILTVINSNGCIETFISYSAIKNSVLNFNFNISAFPSLTCWPDTAIKFVQLPPSRLDIIFLWTFGDPMSGSRNYNQLSWTPTHSYTDPGVYDISLHVELAYCTKDTTICRMVRIQGPKARINLPSRRNNCISNRVLPVEVFYRASSLCLNPDTDSVVFTRRMVVPKYVRSTIDTFCNADTIGFTIKKEFCRTDTSYSLKPTGSRNVYDTISLYFDYWFPGDPIPTGTTYYPPKGNCYPQVMHDTDFFPLNCGAPNYVRFTNNSIKFRKYAAIDDKPPFTPGTVSSDQCKNLSFPWASDSLQFFWDFGDDYALPCTSTIANINILCKYSTEKVPWHLYKKDGCFTAFLTVSDPVTKCTSKDSVKIVMQKPDAGWDTTAYDYLNYQTQLNKPALRPRRGLMLEGNQCAGSPQIINLTEVLPDCEIQDWGIIDDSAKECYHKCTDTTYVDTDFDGKNDTLVFYEDTCYWITKDYLMKNNNPNGFYYTTQGCKTVGLWIRSGDCIDTFWYHNYKYISEVYPQFEILDPDSFKEANQPNVCPGFKPVLTPSIRNQEGIISYRFDIKKKGSSTILYRKFCTLVRDSVLILANKASLSQTIYYPQLGCPDDPINNTKLSDLLKSYIIKDTIYLLSLEDTIITNFALNDPGVYEITSFIKNTLGCTATSIRWIGVGFTADFNANDSVLCLNDTTSFNDTVSYYNLGASGNYVIKYDFNDDGILDSGDFYRYSKPGIISVTMYVTDTVCNIVLKVVKKHYIYVGGVEAEFDSINSPSNCAPQVVGFEDRSWLLTPYYYRYDSAGNKIDSFDADYIVSWKWNFGDHKGTNSISYKQNPTHAYTANGEFDVLHFATTVMGCTDSIIKPDYIRIDGPKPGFDLLDTIGCVPFTAKFVDTSKKVSGWIWQLGDNTQSSGVFNFGDTVDLTYNKVGVFFPNLVGTDSVYNVFMHTYTKCTAIFPDPYNPTAKKYKVTVLPINKLQFTGDTVICTGQEAFFTDRSDTSYNKIFWDFGDSNTLQSNQGAKVSHTYSIPEGIILGNFNILMDGEGSLCPDSPKTKVVTVKRVIAEILWDSLIKSDPVFCFRNFTRGGTQYEWIFKGGNPSYLKSKDTLYKCTNYYTDTGIKTICMKAVNEIQCKDEDCADVINHYMVMIDIPNVFTPGNTLNINDTFTIHSKNIELYNLTIYSRWGDVVFQSNDPAKHWDGNEIKKGKPCSAGTYYYVLEYKFRYLDPKTAVGTVTLIR